MRINIFRNSFVDVQVGMLLDSLDHARRKETEDYWRKTIYQEILDEIRQTEFEGEWCMVVHSCDLIDFIGLKNRAVHSE